MDGKRIAGMLSGHLDLELVQPFLGAASPLERLSGDLSVELKAGGTMDKPELRGKMAIASAVRLRPKDFDRDVVIGSGSFALDEKGVAIQNLAITIDGSTMRLGGRAELGPGFVPQNIQADVDGDVSARLLAFVAPDAVSDAKGKAHVRALVRGTLDKPDIRGRLDLGAIDFRLRDMGTEVQVQSGIVEISNEGVILHNVRVVLDDQGILVIGQSGVRAGRVQFTNLIPFKPGQFDLPLHGEKLTYRSPDTFEVDDLAFDLDLNGNLEEGFELAGEVRLVSGRYLQDFKVQDLVISRRVNESSVRPFYEGKPLLEELALDLSVRTVGEGFVVQNNIAPEIRVDILLHVGGTLAEPQLAGDVRPMDGRFNIPFMRGEFDLVPNVNHVTFIATKSLAAGDTPDLNIEATNLVTDSNGVDHNVRMMIRGPVREARIELTTLEGLDRNQTAMLLLTGTHGEPVARDAEPHRGSERRHGCGRRRSGEPRHDREPDGALHRRQLLSADGLQPAPDRGLGRFPGPRPQAHHPLLQLSRPTTCRGSTATAGGRRGWTRGSSTMSRSACAWNRSGHRRRWGCRRRSPSPPGWSSVWTTQ